MASATRVKPERGSRQVPGRRPNNGPTSERPPPTSDDTYARVEYVPGHDNVYMTLDDNRPTAPDPARTGPGNGRGVSQGHGGSPYQPGSGNNNGSGRREYSNEIRLLVGTSICIILLGLALSGAALWFFLKATHGG
ncbi:hypothetical protein NP493_137g04024 [Ridgeia piscesae]|uniref:Uncharacterized protein n=1 Tax=Ridgeia piscesae TaxID=27915 RepID=A0AAD9P5C3_RIDPI|nr:hypothetical protein NP493_137g04024 [Ridgeia piscesae]